MARFLTEDFVRTDNAGAVSDVFTRNALACAGTGALIGVGTGSVLITAALMPLQVTAAVAASGTAIYAGNRIADGKSLNPFAKAEDSKTDDPKPAAAEAAAA